MKLIDSDNYQIVLNYNYTYDDNIYVGAEIWEEYKKLLKNENDMDYGELKTKLSIVREKLDMFTFNISGNYRDREVKNYTERIGNIFTLKMEKNIFQKMANLKEKNLNKVWVE